MSSVASHALPSAELSIAKLPKDWRIAPLGEFLTASQYGLSVKGGPEGRCPILRMTNQVNGRIKAEKLQYADVTDKQLQSHRVERGDLLFNRTNSLELVGRTAIFDLPGDYVFASYLIRLRAKPDGLDPEFLNFYLGGEQTKKRLKGIATRAVSQSNISATRLQGFPIPLPPLPEQQKIAHILSTVHRAIEAQERIIQTTTELKKALMHKLFTEGLRHEPQKQTEIGPVPESWEVVELGELLKIAQYGMSVKGNPEGKHPILRMTNQVDGQIVGRNLQFVRISDREFERFIVRRGDILFNRTNSLDLVGRTAVFDIEGEFVFASYLIRLRTDGKKLNPFFLNCYFNTDEIQARLKSIATRAVSQSNISATRLRGFPVPKPSLDEQDEIVAHVTALDRKLAVHRAKLKQFQDLFRTLLHELMTAKTRVHEMELSA